MRERAGRAPGSSGSRHLPERARSSRKATWSVSSSTRLELAVSRATCPPSRTLDAEAGGVVRVLEGLEQALGRQSLGERVRVELARRGAQLPGGTSKVRKTGKNSGAGSAARVASKRFQVAKPSSERGSRNRKTRRARG